MGLSAQKTFKQQVNNLVEVMRKMGNPFLDDFPVLVTLDSRDCTNDTVAETILKLEQLGKIQYQNFVKSVIKDRATTISTSIKKNNLPLFGKQPSSTKSKQSKTISTLQNNVALAQLCIAMQTRDADLEEFFRQEAQSFPPSLSEFGNLWLPTMKSDLLKCITNPRQPEPPSQFHCRVFHGVVIVHSLPVSGVWTFDDYVGNVFIPYVCNKSSKQVDIVWDTYVPDGLKESTCEKRGKGVRQSVRQRKDPAEVDAVSVRFS